MKIICILRYKNLKIKRCLIVVLLIIVLIIVTIFILNKAASNVTINDNYIAVFNGGSGELMVQTYVYLNDDIYEYINVTKVTESWESSKWIYKINSTGRFENKEDAFVISKKHGADSYVEIPNDDKQYSMEEFKKYFFV